LRLTDTDGSNERLQNKKNPPAKPLPFRETVSLIKGIISQSFEPFLSIYIEAQDRNLSELIERFVVDARKQSSAAAALPPEMTSEEGGSPVLSSCGDLFVFYKKCLVQCSELSTGQPMLGLAQLFRKYLREYIQRVIVANLPKVRRGGSMLI
jgi:hypothetical protein